jgi:hypothetical protein
MSRGRYRARADARERALVNEAVLAANAKIAELTHELAETRHHLAMIRRSLQSEAMNEARVLADAEIKRLEGEVAAAHEEHNAHVEALAFDLLDLFFEHGAKCPTPHATEAFNIHFCEMFGLSDRFGEIYDYIEKIRLGQQDADAEDEKGDRDLARWERRFTNTTRKVRRANSIAKQMAAGKAAPHRGMAIGRSMGTWGQMPGWREGPKYLLPGKDDHAVDTETGDVYRVCDECEEEEGDEQEA